MLNVFFPPLTFLRAKSTHATSPIFKYFKSPPANPLGLTHMPSRNSSATDKALHLIDKKGWTAYKAAKEVGINLSTIYRALKRRRIANAKN
jgi:transcriptional regulator of acetoin/glycerol metabolism